MTDGKLSVIGVGHPILVQRSGVMPHHCYFYVISTPPLNSNGADGDGKGSALQFEIAAATPARQTLKPGGTVRQGAILFKQSDIFSFTLKGLVPMFEDSLYDQSIRLCFTITS